MSRTNSFIVLFAAATLLAVSLAVSGCAPKGPTYVDAGASYSQSTLASVYALADTSKLASQSAADTTKLRHDALTGLRRQGGTAAAAADLMTKTFPPSTRGVPVYVERALFDGKQALVVVEAIGPATGKLTTKRLWVLSDSGSVLFVGTK